MTMYYEVVITYYTAYDGRLYVYHREYRPIKDFEPSDDPLQMADNALCCGRADAWREERLSSEDIKIAQVYGFGEAGSVFCEYPTGYEEHKEVIYDSTD